MAPKSSRFLPEVCLFVWSHPLDQALTRHRYAPDLTPDQKDALLDAVRVNPHPQIGPEVRRELIDSVARGEPRPDAIEDVEMS